MRSRSLSCWYHDFAIYLFFLGSREKGSRVNVNSRTEPWRSLCGSATRWSRPSRRRAHHEAYRWRKWNGKHSSWKRGTENNRRHVGPQRKGTRRNGRSWRRIFVVWFGVFDSHLFGVRLRVGRLQANFARRLQTRSEETWCRLQSPMACSLLSKSPLAGNWTCAAYGLRADVVAQEYHFSPSNKSNNKEGCNAVRLVNAFSLDSKAFYSYLWRRQPQTQQRACASGCTAHRSRLESAAQSVNVAERLRKAGISFVTTNYDVANAPPSPSHASLSEALVDTLQDDTGLLRQRHEVGTVEIQGADESLIRPGSGTAQGSEGAADAFHRVYHARIDKWSDHLRAELLQEALIFKPPPAVPDPSNSPVFMGLTTYADDVRVTSITADPVHTFSRVMANNAAVDHALEKTAQKHSEARTLCLLCKPTCPAVYGLPSRHGGCFPARQDRLLGTLVLTSTSWAAFDPNVNDGVLRHFEPGPDSAQCGFVRASHCEFGAFFPGAGGLHSENGSGSSSIAPPWLRILGTLLSGSWA